MVVASEVGARDDDQEESTVQLSRPKRQASAVMGRGKGNRLGR